MKRILFYLILFIIPCLVFAQGGSNYSVFGIGDIFSSYNSAYDGLAGTSTAIPSENYINLRNPALWSKVTTTRLQTGYRFNQHVNSVKNVSLYQNNGKVNDILALLSIDTSLGVSVAFGIFPYSNVNYMIRTPLHVTNEDVTLDGNVESQGSGGITQGFIGLSFNIFKDLAVGATVFGDFGMITTKTTTNFFITNAYPAYTEKNDNLSGYGLRGGLYYSGLKDFSFGAFIENHQKLEVDRQYIYQSAVFQDNVLLYDTFNIKIPNAYGFGASYKTGKFLFGMDISLQDFTGFNYQTGPNNEFKNLLQFSLGISRIGNPSLSAEIWDRTTYNIGFCSKQLYYKVAGQDINEMYGAFGMNIPLVGAAILDVSFNLGKRGTSAKDLMTEYFGRLSIDISIGETWFKPFKREY